MLPDVAGSIRGSADTTQSLVALIFRVSGHLPSLSINGCRHPLMAGLVRKVLASPGSPQAQNGTESYRDPGQGRPLWRVEA